MVVRQAVVFTLNLARDTERWSMVAKHWKELGCDPIRVNGITPDDPTFKAILEAGLVSRGVECFRKHPTRRLRDTCPDDCNNMMNPRQLANTIAIRKLIHESFKYLSKNPDEPFVIAGEDDIVPLIDREQWDSIFLPKITEVFAENSGQPVMVGLAKYRCDSDYERLVRSSSRAEVDVEPVGATPPGLSNPCFALNRLAAEKIIRTRSYLNVSSDVAIWRQVSGITCLGLSHRPFKELSFSGEVESTLRTTDDLYRRTTLRDLVIVPPWTTLNDRERIRLQGLRLFLGNAVSSHSGSLPLQVCNQTCLTGRKTFTHFSCDHQENEHGVRRIAVSNLADKCGLKDFHRWCEVSGLTVRNLNKTVDCESIWNVWIRRLYPAVIRAEAR